MRSLVAAALALALVACGPHPLPGTQPSAEKLAREVLSALARRDHLRLAALALTEEEFERRIWPGLPAARPERNMPWSYVWLDLRQKSEAMLQRTVAEHGGRPYTLESVRFEGPSSDHGPYRVHRDTVFVVHESLERKELRLVGAMVEAESRWKVFSYVVDE